MNNLINDLLKKGLGNFIDRSRDALIWDDEIYQECSREEDESEEKCFNMNLTKGQKKVIKNYSPIPSPSSSSTPFIKSRETSILTVSFTPAK